MKLVLKNYISGINYSNYYLAEEQTLMLLFSKVIYTSLPTNNYLNFWLYLQYKSEFRKIVLLCIMLVKPEKSLSQME